MKPGGGVKLREAKVDGVGEVVFEWSDGVSEAVEEAAVVAVDGLEEW